MIDRLDLVTLIKDIRQYFLDKSDVNIENELKDLLVLLDDYYEQFIHADSSLPVMLMAQSMLYQYAIHKKIGPAHIREMRRLCDYYLEKLKEPCLDPRETKETKICTYCDGSGRMLDPHHGHDMQCPQCGRWRSRTSRL